MGSPADQAERNRITGDLDTTLLVEAAAGTGKTTCLIERMVNLLREDRCGIETLVAVTFTRKAAAELRTRFQLALTAAASSCEDERQHRRLVDAADRIEQCFIGTIHSFCSRILRERPFEAGVDPDFSELDEIADSSLRNQVWREHVASLISEDDPVLHELEELGLQIGSDLNRSDKLVQELEQVGLDAAELGPSFLTMAEYADINEWPAKPYPMPDIGPYRSAIVEYIQHMDSFDFPEERGNDELMSRYEEIVRKSKNVDLDSTWELMELLDLFNSRKTIQKMWSDKKIGKRERDRWQAFRDSHIRPLQQHWRRHRYSTCIKAILPARRLYDQKRAEANCLNFADLLLRAARLLAQYPGVRSYFRQRFTHLLVDEFQDTDPVQAQVMMLLTADDVHESDWRKCRPVPGALFVVGDPKQSIYRFRRADIQTYNTVKQIVEKSDGACVSLSANFRSVERVISFVNSTFDEYFPDEATSISPANRHLTVGRSGTANNCVEKILVPASMQYPDEISNFDADFIARMIRRELDEKRPISRTPDEIQNGFPEHVVPSDFLIIARYSVRFRYYARSLQHYGIPFDVSGGSTLKTVPELGLLRSLVAALCCPDDAIAMLTVLRGDLFGMSDVQLYDFRNSGGQLNFRIYPPDGIDVDLRDTFQTAFALLRKLALHLKRFPAGAALERIATDSGLLARAASARDGGNRAGGLMKAIELCRDSADSITSADLASRLEKLIGESARHNTIPLQSSEHGAVRVMTLHQSKGLEAPIVFLADPSGERERPVRSHMDRSEQPKGYLPIYGRPKNKWTISAGRLLAEPDDWEQIADLENQFLEAEKHRLMYVAATRAGSRLIISQRQKRVNDSPWQLFDFAITSVPTVPDPGAMPPAAKVPASTTQANETGDRVLPAERWQAISTASYAVEAIKDLAICSKTTEPRGREKQGKEWGNVLHTLLEAAMRSPGLDLRSVAIATMNAESLPLGLLDDVLSTANNVIESPMWKKAGQSKHCLPEVPISTLGNDDLPTVLRGVIDLAFLQDDGWVIVDYKSERVGETEYPELVEYYRPQLEAYAEHWEKLTGQKVAETAIFFTNTGSYITL